MTPALRLAAWTLAACVAAVGYVEDGVVDAEAKEAAGQSSARLLAGSGVVAQTPVLAAPFAPSPLCLALERGRWRTWAHAQQADGGAWVIVCSYDSAGLYVP